MAIDYIIDMECPVKAELTQEGLVSMVKQRNYAKAIMDVTVPGLLDGEKHHHRPLNTSLPLRSPAPTNA